MWEQVTGRLPSNLIIFSALLSLLLPMAVYKVNQKLHKYGDPPWKKHEKNEDSPVQNSITYPEND